MVPQLRNVLAMGVGFLLIMGGYAPCQNFATSLLNLPCLPVGSISIGSIYAALAISALVAPVFIRKFGERMAMIVTSMAYWSYVLSVSYIITPVVLLTSVNIGLCGGVLNTASGSFLAKNCDDSNRGLYSGIFMAFNQGSSLPGNLLSIFFSFAPPSAPAGGSASGADGLEDDHDPHCGPDTTWRDRVNLGWAGQTSVFFIALAAMCLAGTGALCTIQPPPASHVQGETTATFSTRHSALDTVLHTLSLLGEPVMRSTLLLFLYSGFSNGFWSGVLTEQLSTDSIGLAMVIVGIAEVLGGLCYGKLVNILALGVTYLANTMQGESTDNEGYVQGEIDLMFLVAAFLLGFADNGIMTCIYSIIAEKFENHDATSSASSAGIKQPLMQQDTPTNSNGVGGYCADDAFALLMSMNSLSIMVVFYCGPLLVSHTIAPQVEPPAFLGQVLFVGLWELVAVVLYLILG